MAKRIVLAGGSGFLGQALAQFLKGNGYGVTVLSRGPERTENGIEFKRWNGVTLGDWQETIEGSYAVVNLTGKSVNCIYTRANREEIVSSRLDSVKVLREAIENCSNPPQAFVQAGSLAIFGDTREVCDENSKFGEGFSVDVCKQWEEEFFQKSLPNTRQVFLRIGFVLGRDGGALEPLIKLVKLNLGGTVGSGKQYISWLHIEDLNRMVLASVEDVTFSGVYNATGPSPVTNKEFMKSLRTALGKGWTPPAPSPFVKLGAYVFLRTEPELALTGRNCMPKRLLEQGFHFHYTDLEKTLKEIVGG
ncbi:TIGR01777 family oxidoreductase [Bacillus timonensis]|nr:TIGR01777 family oxidoreductase [Bacillus timonensis]